MTEEEGKQPKQVDTGGGANVGRDVTTGGGDFAGRDFYKIELKGEKISLSEFIIELLYRLSLIKNHTYKFFSFVRGHQTYSEPELIASAKSLKNHLAGKGGGGKLFREEATRYLFFSLGHAYPDLDPSLEVKDCINDLSWMVNSFHEIIESNESLTSYIFDNRDELLLRLHKAFDELSTQTELLSNLEINV